MTATDLFGYNPGAKFASRGGDLTNDLSVEATVAQHNIWHRNEVDGAAETSPS